MHKPSAKQLLDCRHDTLLLWQNVGLQAGNAGREGVRCLPRPGQSVLARCVPRVHHEEVPDVAPQKHRDLTSASQATARERSGTHLFIKQHMLGSTREAAIRAQPSPTASYAREHQRCSNHLVSSIPSAVASSGAPAPLLSLVSSYRGLCRMDRKEYVHTERLKATAAPCWGFEPRPQRAPSPNRPCRILPSLVAWAFSSAKEAVRVQSQSEVECCDRLETGAGLRPGRQAKLWNGKF